MKFRRGLLGLFCLCLVTLCAHSAVAGAQDFQLFNRTGVDIYALYVSPTGVEEWEEDILGADVLLTGADLDILFDRAEEAEYWDIRIEDDEGNALIFEGVNLFEAYQVVLEDDGTARIK
jgi:hypothetical protein